MRMCSLFLQCALYNTFRLVGRFFLPVGHFYVSFQFNSGFVFEACRSTGVVSFIAIWDGLLSLVFFHYAHKMVSANIFFCYALISSSILSLQSFFAISTTAAAARSNNNNNKINLLELLTAANIWTCTKSEKCVKWLKFLAISRCKRSNGNKFYGYGQRMNVTEEQKKNVTSAFTTQAKERIELIRFLLWQKKKFVHRKRGAASSPIEMAKAL